MSVSVLRTRLLVQSTSLNYRQGSCNTNCSVHAKHTTVDATGTVPDSIFYLCGTAKGELEDGQWNTVFEDTIAPRGSRPAN